LVGPEARLEMEAHLKLVSPTFYHTRVYLSTIRENIKNNYLNRIRGLILIELRNTYNILIHIRITHCSRENNSYPDDERRWPSLT